MGTKGFVQVSTYSPILGVTSDGFPENLTALAQNMMIAARSMGVLTKFRKGHTEIVNLVMQKVAEKSDGWAFVDTYHNAEWVSYSAVLDPKTGNVQLYEGKREHRI